ncbi:MAG: hypothetical protein V7727_15140 [Sneathiella sp.]
MYKRDVEILVDEGGGRRIFSDPYAGPTFTVSLEGSGFGAGNVIGGIRMPRWEISLHGGTDPHANTWDAVYKIKSKYLAALDADFLIWIRQFALWFVKEIGRGKSSLDVAEELARYINNVVLGGFVDRPFLKAEAFRFVDQSCKDSFIRNDVREWLMGFC